jgi:flagellar motor switch protein FliN/FliY
MNERLSREEADDLLTQETPEGTPPKEKPSLQRLGRRKDAAIPPKEEPRVQESALEAPGPSVEPAVFGELSGDVGGEAPVAGMEVLLDVPLSVSVELGRARCRVKDLLNLAVGSIVELDKAAGENVDVLVNGRVFARGEVVVVDENFGVRVTHIVSKSAVEKGTRKIT